MPDGKDNLKKLHGNLIKDGYELPSFDVFQKDMSDATKIAKLRDNLVKDGYELPDLKTFQMDMGFGEKKNQVDSTLGGTAGISGPPLRKEKVLDYLQSLKNPATVIKVGKEPIVSGEEAVLPVQKPKKTDTTFGLSKERVSTAISPKVEEISIAADPIGEAEKKASQTKNLQEAADYIAAADIFKQVSIPSGHDAYVLAASPLVKEDNATSRVVLQRANQYAAATEGLRQIKDVPDLSTANEGFIEQNVMPKIERAAVIYAVKTNPSFEKELKAAGTSIDDPNLKYALGSAKMGSIMNEFLESPDVSSFVKSENPNLAIAVQYAKDKNLERNTEFGISQVANKVSRAFERSDKKRNIIAPFATESLKSDIDEVAKDKLSPEEYGIYQKYIKGREEEYLDTPSMLGAFAEHGGAVLEGFANTLSKVTGVDKEDVIRDKWRKEVMNVSANPEGFRKYLTDVSGVAGLVTSLYATGGALKGGLTIAGMAPKAAANISEAVNVGTAFFGDMVDEGIAKYPDSPVKAYTSAAFNTLLFMAMGRDIFPGTKVNSAFAKVKPEVEKVVQNLANGNITKEAARQQLNTLGKTAIDIAAEGAKQNVKVSAELTGLGILNEGLDMIMDMDEDKIRKYYPEGVHGDTFKSMFLSNSLVSALAGFGKVKARNNMAKEAIYEAASNPKRYERIINEIIIKDPNITREELLNNLAFAVETKRLLDQRGIPEDKQKSYLLKALGERAAIAEAEKIKDTNLKKQAEEKIKEAQTEKDAILAGEEVPEETITPELPVTPEKAPEEIVAGEETPITPEEELPFGEVAPREVKETKEETNLKQRALNVEPLNPLVEVMQYFINGGKINPTALEELFGKQKRMGMGKIRVEERKSRTALTNKNAPGIEQLAERLSGTDRTEQFADFRDAIEQTLLNHSGIKTMAEEVIRDYDIDFAEQKRMAELEDMGRDIEIETQNFLSQVPEAQKEEISAVLDRFRDEQGFIDWRKIDEELAGGFEPILLDLSPESQKIIENGINQIKERGRISGVPTEAVPEPAKAGDILRAAAEATRAGKISKLGGFRAGTGFDAVWDASLEVIAKALEGGASVADAIEQGLKYVKSTGWYKKLTDKQDFENKYRNHLNKEYDAVSIKAAGEVPVQPEARAGEKMEGGIPPAEPKEPAKEGKVPEVTGEKKEVVPPEVLPTKEIPLTEEPDGWSSIRKEKLQEIDEVRKSYEKQKKVSWSKTYQSALENVQKMFPKKSLYEAMQARIMELSNRVSKGELFNPSSEDLAVFNVLKAETEKRIKDVEGLDSKDPIRRDMAIAELDNLNEQLISIAKLANPEEGGRAFAFRQSEILLDDNNGLKIRRMELQKAKGGEPLTAEEEAFVKAHWEKEKALLLEEQKVREEQMKEQFDSQLDALQKKYEEKLAKVAKTPAGRTAKEKTLSQKGKDTADAIRKLKLKGVKLDFTLGSWNLAIEGIAQLVEKGSTIAEAIDTLIKNKTIGFKNQDDKDKFEALLVDKLKQKNREEQIDKIKDFAKENDITDLTKEMVGKNLIKDYFNSLIGEYPKEQIFEEAYKELKEILPNITKEGLREAFLKEGDYKQPTKKQLEGSIAQQERELKKLTKEQLTADQQQKIKLQQEKDKLIKRRDEYKRKLKNNEFTEPKPPVKLKKYDAELIRIKKSEAQANQEFREKERKIIEKNKSNIERWADTIKSAIVTALIGGPKTLLKVASMSLIRPLSETARRATLGKVFDLFFPGISKAAKVGGESSSFKSLSSGFEAYFRQMGEKKIKQKYEKASNEYEEALAAYQEYKELEEVDPKELERLKKNYEDKLLKAQGYFLYQFIGGSSIKDALRALINRSNEIEERFGKVAKESIQDGGKLKKLSYIWEFLGRSHSALKTFSGRFSFASSFMARLEGALERGEDITSPDKLLEIAHESYLDWERGKYQQSNMISDKWASIIGSLVKKTDTKEEQRLSKALRYILSADVAVTRVPVNILHEALVEYTFGVFKAIRELAKVNKEIRGQLKEEGFTNGEKILDDITSGTSKKEFKAALREKFSQMDAKQAATIFRCFTKGGVGLGLYALALISGAISFGIFPYKGQKKKKEEEELAPGELNPGQVAIGDNRFGEVASSIVEHAPATFPLFMGIGMAQAYKDEINKGKTTPEAAAKSIYIHLGILESDVPQSKVFSPLTVGKSFYQALKKRGEEVGLVEETVVAPKVKDPQSGKKRDMTKDEVTSYKESYSQKYRDLIDDYKNMDKMVWINPDGNIVLDKEDVSEKDQEYLEEKYYSDLSGMEIQKLYKKLKTKAKSSSLKELTLEEVEEEK